MNHLNKSSATQGLLLSALIGALSSCSLSGKGEGSSLYVDLSSLEGHGSRHALLNSSGPLYGLGTPPAASTGFNCYAVNVTGPGISDSSPHAGGDIGVVFDRLLNVPGSYCSYRGVVSPPVFLNGGSSDVALQVPAGGVRLVQVVGVNDSLVCASGVVGNENTPNGGVSRYFEVGRAVLNDVFSDRSVNIAMNWPTGLTAADDAARAARSMDCGDGSCGNFSEIQQSGSLANFVIMSSLQKYAFKITPATGKYIRKISLLVMGYLAAGATGTVDATVEIYSGAAGGNIANMQPTGFSSSHSLTNSAATPVIAFDMYNANNQYLQMVPNTDYWVVVSSADSTTTPYAKSLILVNNNVDVATGFPAVPFELGMGNVNGGTINWSWTPETTAGTINQIYGCGN